MKWALITTFLFWGLTIGVSSQQQPSSVSKDVVLSKGKPTVYIAFERVGERKPVYVNESNKGVWLRLYNNTNWGIMFSTASLYIPPKVVTFTLSDGQKALGLRDGLEVNACHGVEQIDSYESYKTPNGGMVINQSVKVTDIPIGYNRGSDAHSSAWLQPGHSVLFSIPKEHLAKHLAVYISFNYEWECEQGNCNTAEPEHRVYFRASNLPKSVATK